jgi:hypothetical protein
VRVLLLQLDGTGPNLALMRLAAHHRGLGDDVELRRVAGPDAAERRLGDAFDRVYASAIFERSRPTAERVRRVYPGTIVGGAGLDESMTLEAVGVPTRGPVDYSDWPAFRASLGFTQRGCRYDCSFCKVPRMKAEGRPRPETTVTDIWRGEPWPRWVLLYDNDFFGVPSWRHVVEELVAGRFRVCFNQGINVRALGDEAAAALASVDYRDDSFRDRRLYTAWDNLGDEARLFRGLALLARHGVRPDDVMVYMLVGYDHDARAARPGLTPGDFRRHARLREFGARPYPMPYVRTPELRGFQRWVVGAYDKRVPWRDWEAAGYDPRRLGGPRGMGPLPLFD